MLLSCNQKYSSRKNEHDHAFVMGKHLFDIEAHQGIEF